LLTADKYVYQRNIIKEDILELIDDYNYNLDKAEELNDKLTELLDGESVRSIIILTQ